MSLIETKGTTTKATSKAEREKAEEVKKNTTQNTIQDSKEASLKTRESIEVHIKKIVTEAVIMKKGGIQGAEITTIDQEAKVILRRAVEIEEIAGSIPAGQVVGTAAEAL